MAVFGVVLKETKEAQDFIKETNKRFDSANMVSNPFKGEINAFVEEKKGLNNLVTVVNMAPLWPNFTWAVALIMFLPMVFLSSVETLIKLLPLPLSFLLMGFFWSETFFFIMFTAGLKKAGYKGPHFKQLSKDKIILALTRRI